jgi:hypothetical protein
MATLRQAAEVMTDQLRERVDRLVAAVEKDGTDFTQIARLADAVGEAADTIGETFTDLEHALMQGLRGDSQSERASRRGRRQQSESNGSTAESPTKEELLEEAREMNIHGRSSMSKDKLARAVEAEESVTKDELLERARRAGIEGRSSMTKDELRKALSRAGV